ncbi:MAG: YggS family pyridoxal phosphate-dependent enzyme [Defluviitaleaceae bacterium]|nr:YggS family pyridoxal phosphate-dependent enzyme [Defluviitaleaceae bacterium]MCL2273799.1 YggS family pyridoxal phosphate-dependent enzyme [Defluviitaleaceae bacterium]
MVNDKNIIRENVAKIRENIAQAAQKSGRNASDITLIGVTKTLHPTTINEIIEAGVTHLGENRVQEFLPKYEELLPQSPTWHFIGHLQRNKVKQAVDKISFIHSIDSLELAKEVDKRAESLKKRIDILLEINIANEPSKYGTCPEKANELAKHLFELKFINFRGLMCVAPFVENGEKNRSFFSKMQKISYKIMLDFKKNSLYDIAPLELSMGMSDDYSVAIEEGATMVRIGTALAGNR